MSINDLLVVGDGIRAPSMPGDVGYNLYFEHEVQIDGPGITWVDVDARVKLPDNCWGLITARSSAAVLYDVIIINGVIDNGYIGQLKVGIVNYRGYIHIPKGASLAQLIIMPMVVRQMRQVACLPETGRGINGFGSTDAR